MDGVNRIPKCRILWNERPKDRYVGGGGDIDEIVMSDVAMVHIEQMDDRCWWIALYAYDEKYWMGNFTCDSRGRMQFVEQEDNCIEWEEDSTHEHPDPDEQTP